MITFEKVINCFLLKHDLILDQILTEWSLIFHKDYRNWYEIFIINETEIAINYRQEPSKKISTLVVKFDEISENTFIELKNKAA